jgi:hypothetical protein
MIFLMRGNFDVDEQLVCPLWFGSSIRSLVCG